MSRPLVYVLALAGAIAILVLAGSGAIYLRSQRLIAASAAGGQLNLASDRTGVFSPADDPPEIKGTRRSVRVAVIGGMFFTGFWADLAKRYELASGVHVDLIAEGEKNDIAKAFLGGGIDVITMHASDTIINLVAGGYALDPQPWMRNDLVIVGPRTDPAKIRGMTDAAAALKRIAQTHSPFVVHSSLGAQEVLVNILQPNGIVLDASHLTILFDDQQRSALKVAGEKGAYTLVGRIPFRTGRMPNDGLVLMVQGDERLRRPFVVAVANPKRFAGIHYGLARQFAEYLREPATQQWIAGYGRGLIDSDPLFFPVQLPDQVPRGADVNPLPQR